MLGPERILALDIGASTVKVGEFQASKGQGLRLTNFNFADLGIDPEHEENRKALIVSTVRNVVREKNIKATNVVFSVSGQSVFTRFVKLPPVDESKVTQIIQYEAQQNVPFPIDEVIWDYQLLGKNPDGELEVVLLAIKSDIIEDLTEGVESCGLQTEMVDVAPMALYNAVRYNYGDLEGCTMVVDLGARTTNLLFLEQHRVFSRSIPIAGNAITQSIASEFNIPFLEAEQMKKAQGFVALGGAYEEPESETQARVSKIIRNVMTRLHAEIARSINFYKGQQGGSPPARVLLSGGSSIIPYTDRFFKEKIQTDIEYFNPFRNVEIDSRISREELARSAHFFGEVVGLGLRKHTECPIEVDLLPNSVRARQQMKHKRPYLAGAGVCVLLIPLCWLGYTQKTMNLTRRQLDVVSDKVNNLNDLSQKLAREQGQLAELNGKADQVISLIQQRSLWPELLQDLNRRLGSNNIWIVSLTPQADTGSGGPAPVSGGSARGRGRMRPGAEEGEGEAAPSSAPAAGSSKTIGELRIEGAGIHSAENPERDIQSVEDFKQSLSESTNFFDKAGVEIVVPPNPMLQGQTFTFTVRAKLAKPLSM
ncbi:MAG TPA: type IV pilus assembly protein PilM [Verrucomicrobiae bacterium]|nr:type IV pilus assembly protein PilM [Verrucomicrobiae bacterium]